MTIEKTGTTALAPLAFFIPGLDGGGAQRVFVTLVNTLVNLTNHPIHLVTSREGGAFENLVDERVVRVFLGQKRASLSILPLARYIRTERPAAMVSTLDYCNVIFLVATMFARVPMRKIVREANVIPDQTNSIWEEIKSRGLRFLMRLLYRRADDIIIIAKDVERSLIRHRIAPVGMMRRIPNPVAANQLRQVQLTEATLPNGPFILGIGRLTYQKGFDILINAFSQLHNKNVFLVILGDGPLKETLRALCCQLGVQDRVYMPGFVQNPHSYLKCASLFVLSSRWEGFPNVLLEGLAAGVPIVATACPGSSSEVLNGGTLGRLVPVDDPTGLAAAIQDEISESSSTAEARVARAAEYDSREIAKRYLEVMANGVLAVES